MENATKALLIAASVLIVIILIAVSIKILGSASGVSDQVDTVSSSLESSMFNSQFTSYFGDRVPGSQAKSLVSKIIINNSQNPNHVVLCNILEKQSGSWTRIGAAHTKDQPNISGLQNIYNLIDDNAVYKIGVAYNCGHYGSTNGYHTDGYIACIAIYKVD